MVILCRIRGWSKTCTLLTGAPPAGVLPHGSIPRGGPPPSPRPRRGQYEGGIVHRDGRIRPAVLDLMPPLQEQAFDVFFEGKSRVIGAERDLQRRASSMVSRGMAPSRTTRGGFGGVSTTVDSRPWRGGPAP